MKKKLLIGVAILVALFLILVGYYVIFDMNQESKLRKEMEELSQLANSDDIDMQKIDQYLSRTITKGDYAVVEKACKAYLRDGLNNIVEIILLLDDEQMTSLLTIENYIEDGKDFIETKQYIANTKDELETCKEQYREFLTEEKAMSYIEGKGLDDYYIDFYKRELIGDINRDETDEMLEQTVDDMIAILTNSETVIDFLIENADHWQLSEENIMFDDTRFQKEYEELLSKVVE